MANLDGPTYTTYSYKLRSSGIVPIGPSKFVAQTFGVDKNEIVLYEATKVLPNTEDFIGANPDAEYIAANFQRLPYLDQNDNNLFSGQTTGLTEFDSEESMPGGVL